MSAQINDQRLLATFRVADLNLGVDVGCVQEVLSHQEPTKVPLAATVIAGLVNLRGEIITALHLRERLGLPANAGNRGGMSLILRTEHGPVSLVVDAIGDVLEVGAQTHEPLPATVPARTRVLLDGVYKLPGRLLLVLDVKKALDLASTRGEGR